MAKIQKLPESLIRLIAAGEVIERPASVVKELVENSLDAGATSVSIDLWSAGRTRIRISDDGTGMSREDAELALDRHATSKLQKFDDLQAMATFGFRGEALPSIAAVSRLELSTRPRDADQGWSLLLEGGKLLSAKAAGIPAGTTIDVQDLFFNTPARSKFLKRDSTERSHVLKTVQEIALAHPAVGFDVAMDGKTILTLPRGESLGQRIATLWGLSATEQQLVPVQFSRGPCTLRGFVNAIPSHHPTRAYQVLFVNQRPVQQRMLNHAIYESYREWLPVGRHPVYCLFIDLDPTLVDVNVHPTKREVRISDERAVYDVLYSTIRALFKEHTAALSLDTLSPTWERVEPTVAAATGERRVRGALPSADESKLAFFSQLPLANSLSTDQVADAPASTANGPLTPTLPHTTRDCGAIGTEEATVSHKGRGDSIDATALRYLGQFQKLYLLFEQGEELLLVDQHAAAERVLYERLLAQVATGAAGLPAGRQALLTPLLWDVSPDQAETVRSFQPELEKMGFILEEFGPHSFALKEWPAVLPETKQAKRFLEEVLDAFQNEKPATTTDIQHQIAARAACRAAVMASDSLALPEVTRLMEDLSACERPMTCPHGRPTHIRLSLAELNRRFRRT